MSQESRGMSQEFVEVSFSQTDRSVMTHVSYLMALRLKGAL